MNDILMIEGDRGQEIRRRLAVASILGIAASAGFHLPDLSPTAGREFPIDPSPKAAERIAAAEAKRARKNAKRGAHTQREQP